MRAAVRLGLLLLVLSACSRQGDAPNKTPETPTPVTAPAPQASAAPATPSAPAGDFSGVIEGSIVLAEGATLPQQVDPRDASKYALTDPPAPCSKIGPIDLTPVQRDRSGGLSNVHIALTGMKSTATYTPETHELLLTDCRLARPLLAVMRGDTVRIKNLSSAPLLPSMPGDKFMQAILPNEARELEIKGLGAMRIACGFSSYCGQTDVLSTSHRLYAVTGRDGRFRIEQVPLDQELTVHAWHPLFEEASFTLRLTKDKPRQQVDLKLKPAAPQAAPKAQGKAAKEPLKPGAIAPPI